MIDIDSDQAADGDVCVQVDGREVLAQAGEHPARAILLAAKLAPERELVQLIGGREVIVTGEVMVTGGEVFVSRPR
jgi:hypothetical protein